MLYCKQSVLHNLARKGGCFLSDFMLALPGILFWVVLFVVLRATRKCRDEASKNAAQKKLVSDVVATIERMAPDFDGASVICSKYSNGGCVRFGSLRGGQFEYDFDSHGYVVSEGMAFVLAAAIAKRFGSEYRMIHDRGDFNGDYRVIGPRQLAEEREEKRRRDSLKHL